MPVVELPPHESISADEAVTYLFANLSLKPLVRGEKCSHKYASISDEDWHKIADVLHRRGQDFTLKCQACGGFVRASQFKLD